MSWPLPPPLRDPTNDKGELRARRGGTDSKTHLNHTIIRLCVTHFLLPQQKGMSEYPTSLIAQRLNLLPQLLQLGHAQQDQIVRSNRTDRIRSFPIQWWWQS